MLLVLVQPWALSDFVVIQHGKRLKEIEVYFVSKFFFFCLPLSGDFSFAILGRRWWLWLNAGLLAVLL